MFQLPALPPVSQFQRRLALFMAGVFAAIELALQGADLGLYAPDLRWRVYEAYSFYDPWFDAWMQGEPAPGQVLPSLLTHAFLHGGMTHLLLNAAVFLGLGLLTMRVFGTLRFLAIFAVSAVAGAVCFGLIADARGPLVGASGAIFGLLGALKMFEIDCIRAFGGSWAQYWRVIGALVLVNVLLWAGLGGLLAWEAHLGGFLGGFALAWVFMRTGGPSV